MSEIPPKKPNSGQFKAGKSGNPGGRPPKDSTKDRKVEKLMTEEEIIFDGDPLAYLAKHAEYYSRVGSHQKALELAKEIMPYLNPRMGNVAAQQPDNEIIIRFEDPEDK
jgi:hypothetical protein